MRKLLVANRGEIAIRILRSARDLGIPTVAVYAADDAASRHRALADQACALAASGPAAYLDRAALLAVAREQGADAIHPGYGFLSERADFAAACAAAGIAFVGPDAAQLALFGDKGRALALARQCEVPVMPATAADASLEELEAFFEAQQGGGIVLKAVGGGGGRGMKLVRERAELAEAWRRCRSEAASAFGVDAVYAERLVARARHIEVQIIGDGQTVQALGDRDCSLQRRFQKLIEIAPAPRLSPALREAIRAAAIRMATTVGYRSLGTFEFLVEEDAAGQQTGFVFIEANPRLQVEHTVTEQVCGLDLVELQLRLADGATLAELGLLDAASGQPRWAPRGYAIQARLNAEQTDASGLARPARGRLEVFDLPAGPDVRVDTHGQVGYTPAPAYDTLLAKLIVSTRSERFDDAVRRLRRALAECRISGVQTNLDLLAAIAARPEFDSQHVHTRFFETVFEELLAEAGAIAERRCQHDEAVGWIGQTASGQPEREARGRTAADSLAGSLADSAAASSAIVPEEPLLADGSLALRAPLDGRVVEMTLAAGDPVRAGQTLAVIDAMKMEHTVAAPETGWVAELRVAAGDQVQEGQVLAVVTADAAAADPALPLAGSDGQAAARVRPDLQKLLDREALLADAARPAAVARRRGRGQRTARENLADLCDPGSFIEYGALAYAAQASRRSVEDLIANTPADGLITGTATINAACFTPEQTRCAVLLYDATVLAGTQGKRNHMKADRILDIAARDRLPTVLFAEGGGGRPGDVDFPSIAGLYQPAFAAMAELSGEVPAIGVVSGRCFAGNAALLGCCDVIIATRNANIGMAGPAMIEGGGLGQYRPEDIGPSAVQHANGVIDLLVDDEAAAVVAVRQYLSYFQGTLAQWSAPAAQAARAVVPENRLRVYDSRAAILALADEGSVLVLRTGFGAGIHVALARIEGRPVGIIANNPQHLGGAIDPDAADKAARFMQLCDAHQLPLLALIDTPGFMVGPDVEARAQVRHVSRLFLAGAKLRVPLLAIVLRKGYGLGAMAMAGGGFRSPGLICSWPTGEFGGMGLEGAVRLGFRKELEALPEGPERDALYRQLVERMYARGHALSAAAGLEIDAVIDPAESRRWIVAGLDAGLSRRGAPRRGFVDAW